MKKNTLLILIFFAHLLNGQEIQGELEPELNYTIKNLSINTKYQDYGASYFGESTVIFASSRKVKTIRNKVWDGNEQPFLELYTGAYAENGDVSEVERFSKRINSKFHDADVVFTKDLKTIYFTRNNYLNKKFKKDTLNWNLNQLYRATIGEKDDWEVHGMPFNSDNHQTGHPVLNASEDKLYFISDMLGGYGETDIYVVDILSDGTYSAPRNLGPDVNTKGKEMFPFVDANNVLYFSSDGYVDGMGGLDVYVTKLKEGGVPSKKAENIGMPINSNKDDFSFVRKVNTNLGYFSSNRVGGKGDDDIYSFVELKPLMFDCNQYVQGVVRDKRTGALIPGALVELFSESGTLIESVIADKYAAFNFKVVCETPYKVVGSKQDYTEDSKEFVTSNVDDLELELGLTLDSTDFVTVRGLLMVNINPIYFDLDKSFIRNDAAIELEKVISIMKKYPEIIIDFGSHTDSRGSDKYNWALSNRRAKATIAWIIHRGIDASRISGKGYGETQLVNECTNNVKCSEAAHQLNRRSEFIIVNPEAIK